MADDRVDEAHLRADLAWLATTATDALSVAQQYGPMWPESRAAFDAVRRHAKGLQCAAALLQQQLRYGK